MATATRTELLTGGWSSLGTPFIQVSSPIGTDTVADGLSLWARPFVWVPSGEAPDIEGVLADVELPAMTGAIGGAHGAAGDIGDIELPVFGLSMEGARGNSGTLSGIGLPMLGASIQALHFESLPRAPEGAGMALAGESLADILRRISRRRFAALGAIRLPAFGAALRGRRGVRGDMVMLMPSLGLYMQGAGPVRGRAAVGLPRFSAAILGNIGPTEDQALGALADALERLE